MINITYSPEKEKKIKGSILLGDNSELGRNLKDTCASKKQKICIYNMFTCKEPTIQLLFTCNTNYFYYK